MTCSRSEEFEMSVIGASCSNWTNNSLTVEPDRMIHTEAYNEQTIRNINVIDSSDVHLGDTFVAVSHNVQNTNVAQGRILGVTKTTLVSKQNTKRLRCSIAVFVCWTFVVASVLLYFVFYFALAKKPTRMDLDINEPWYLRRHQWYANPERSIEELELPVKMVIIGHSALDFCTNKYDCIKNISHIQVLHQFDFEWTDIGPNFLVGGNGLVFEGRGANVLGAMVRWFNYKIISIMFLGDYVKDKPNIEQFNNVNVVLQALVRKRVLTADYTLYGHCQVVGGIISPGPHVMDNLHHFDHWHSANKTTCVRSYTPH